METVLIFLRQYWREILEILALLLSIVICCVRKKPVKVVDTIKEVIIRVLPAFIIKAEASDKKGADKLYYVLDLVKGFLKEMSYGDDVISQYLPFAKEQVELILSTPQKKIRR